MSRPAALLLRVLLPLLLAAPAAAQQDLPEAPPGTVPFALEVVPHDGRGRREVPTWERGGVLYMTVNHLARILGGTYFWLSDLGKVTLEVEGRKAWVMDGSDIAVIGEGEVLHLPGPAFLWHGKMLVPLALVVDDAGRGRRWIPRDIAFYRQDRLLLAGTLQRGEVTELKVVPDPLGWKLVVTASGPFRHRTVRDETASFRLRLDGVDYDPLLFPAPLESPWFQGLRMRSVEGAVELAFTPARAARGYGIEVNRERTELEVLLGLDERDLREGTLRPFTDAGRGRAAEIRTVALDPGHGRDAEGKLTLELCRRLGERLRLQYGLETVFTREDAENPGPATRADRANRSGADLFISLHFHEGEGGPTAFVARPAGGGEAVPVELRGLGFRRFDAAQDPVLPLSRSLAQSLVDAVAGRLELPPGGVHDEALAELQGAAMPAVLLEMGWDPKAPRDATLEAAAEGIVEGIRLYLLYEEEYR